MNILIISYMYPSMDRIEENRDSLFLHNYARNWSGMGHRVRVEHLALVYPRCFNLLCHKVKRMATYGRGWINYQKKRYHADGVFIERRPMMKFIPHGLYPRLSLRRSASAIRRQLEQDRFEPDIVICDYLNPAVEICRRLAFPDAVKRYAIIHDTDARFLRKHPGYVERMTGITRIAYRSEALKKQCADRLGSWDSFFIPSGIEKKYIPQANTPRTRIANILVVSSFLPRKHVDCVIRAVGNLNRRGAGYSLTIVGEGNRRDELEALAGTYGADAWCAFVGKKSKDDVIRYMRNADLFVLLSSGETFGMVYVEAMSQGCITIGSRDEGIDGIIVDGQNGFLLPAGDADALERKIEELGALGAEELGRISDAAADTGRSLAEENLAEQLLQVMRG